RASVLELILPQAFCPADAGWRRLWSLGSGRHLDRRRVGVALIGFTVAPAASADINGRADAMPPVSIAAVHGSIGGAGLSAFAVAGGAFLWLVRKFRSRQR